MSDLATDSERALCYHAIEEAQRKGLLAVIHKVSVCDWLVTLRAQARTDLENERELWRSSINMFLETESGSTEENDAVLALAALIEHPSAHPEE